MYLDVSGFGTEIAPQRQPFNEIGYREGRAAYVTLYENNNSSTYQQTLDNKYEVSSTTGGHFRSPQLISLEEIKMFDDKRELPLSQILGKTRPEVDSLLKRLNKTNSVRQFNLPK